MANFGDQVVVVVLPLPAQGHLNQLLHLSRLVASYGIPVHFVCTATHNRQAKLRIHGYNPLSISHLHFHDLPTPPFLSPPPKPDLSSRYPSHLLPSFKASAELRQPVAALLRQISASATRRVVVIHDSLMSTVVQDVPSIPKAESYSFLCTSALTSFSFLWKATGKQFPAVAELEGLPSMESCFTREAIEFNSSQHGFEIFQSGIVLNTSRVVESKFLDLFETEALFGKSPIWALGPFNPVEIHNDLSPTVPRQPCLDWLDQQPKDSVIFVSFGTTTSLTNEDIEELAIGLDRSGQNFIWVLREADKGDVFEGGEKKTKLPEGYEERVEGRGVIVRGWAPQLEILGHPSTGGFMSHCGWNSCMESISMGVPMAAWPMHSDQPRNAFLVTQILGIGLAVKDWDRQRDELVTQSAVAAAVKKLMASNEGKEMRKSAEELGEAVRQSVADGGLRRRELDSFISHITRDK